MARIRFELYAVGTDTGQRLLENYIAPAIRTRGSLAPDTVYVVPTQRMERVAEKTLLHLLGGVVLGEPVITWNRLVSKAHSAYVGNPIISGDERMALIQDILIREGSSYEVLDIAAGFPGVAAVISDLISEIKQNGLLTTTSLSERLTSAGCDTKEGFFSDFISVFNSYQNCLSRSGNRLNKTFHDEEEAIHLCAEAISMSGHERFLPGVKLLVFSGFYDFNSLQRKFISSLIKSVEQSVICFELGAGCAPEHLSGNVTFKLPLETLNYFKNIGVAYEVCRKEPETVSPRQIAADKLFTSLTVCPTDEKKDASVNFICADNATDEIERVAAKIKRLCANNLYSPSQIAVVFPSLESRLSLIEDIFPRYGIPYHVDIGVPLISSPLMEMFLNMLEAPERGFKRQTVFNLLSSPCISLGRPCESLDFKVDPYYFDTLAREAMIVGGHVDGGGQGWLVKLRSLSKKLEWQLKCSVSANSSEDSERTPPRSQISNKLILVDSYITFFTNLLKALNPLASPTRLPLNEYFRYIRELMEYFEVENIIYGAKDESISQGGRSHLINALKTIYSGLNECESILSLVSPSEGFHPSEYNKSIVALLRGLKYRCNNRRDGISVMGFYETRGLCFDVLFLCGMTENEIPRKVNSFPMLKQSDYARIGFKSIRTDVSEEQLLLHRIAASVPRLYLSYPSYSGDTINIKSRFLDEMERRYEPQQVAQPDSILTNKQWLTATGRAATDKCDPGVLLDTMRYAAAAGMRESFSSLFHNCGIAVKRDLDTLSEYDGLITEEELRKNINLRFLCGAHEFSATQIETYARCPFKFFCSKYVLNLRAPEEIEEDIPPTTTGVLIHGILKQFYRERVPEAGTPATPVTFNNLDAAKKRLYEIASEQLAGLPFTGLFRDRYEENILRGLANNDSIADRGPGMLLSFLVRETQNDEILKPLYFESRFSGVTALTVGKGSLQSCCLHLDVGNAKALFTGVIDRIDTASISGIQHYFVVDYKTGRAKSINDTLTGLDFQLPLYLLFLTGITSEDNLIGAAYDYISNNPDKSGRLTFYARRKHKTKPGSDTPMITTRSIQGFFDDESFHDMLAITRARIANIVNAISEGNFNHTLLGADIGGCRYCEFKSICRVDLCRMKRVSKHLNIAPSTRGYYMPDSVSRKDDEAGNESDE